MGEIAVRTALGASRARVVSQLFVEALVPSCAAAALGLGILHVALKMIRAAIENEDDGASMLPLLIDFQLTPTVILYVTLLAIVAAVIAGVLPALKATGTASPAGAAAVLGARCRRAARADVDGAHRPAGRGRGGGAAGGALQRQRGSIRLAAQRPAAAAHGLVSATAHPIARRTRARGSRQRLPEFTSP